MSILVHLPRSELASELGICSVETEQLKPAGWGPSGRNNDPVMIKISIPFVRFQHIEAPRIDAIAAKGEEPR